MRTTLAEFVQAHIPQMATRTVRYFK